jgi:nucleoside-diphosphate-sugar epimerase
LAEGGEVLAPDSPERRAQVIDVRDLAAWIVTGAQQGLTGVFDGVAPPAPLGDLLAATARGVGAEPRLTWVPQDVLEEQEVAPWAGPRSLPLHLPLPEYAGLGTHDVTDSLAAGLRIRPLEETSADTLAWLRAHSEVARTGLTRAEERAVLDAWHASAG